MAPRMQVMPTSTPRVYQERVGLFGPRVERQSIGKDDLRANSMANLTMQM